jgi:catechol 2,3-dioxygenase-like lactoylglutathione lyase family enzyme
MLGKKQVHATLAVKNLETARKFYEGLVGLTPAASQEPGTVRYETGGAPIFVYPSQYAGTNQATAVTWIVGTEIEELVGALKVKGVVFEHYDLPGVTRRGDLHIGEGRKLAWFKDPDGNIHALAGR